MKISYKKSFLIFFMSFILLFLSGCVDMETELIFQKDGTEGKTQSVDWSPCGQYIASSSTNNDIKIWNAVTGNTMKSWYDLSAIVSDISWSPEGNYLAGGGSDGAVRIWGDDYTVVGEEDAESDIVEFEDYNLEKIVREVIDKTEGEIYLEEVLLIKELNVVGRGERAIKSFEGIQQLKNLESLSFLGYKIESLQPLAALENLKELSFGAWEPTSIEDISPLVDLNNLQYLDIGGNRINDITPLENLTNLRELNLSINPIEDISALKQLGNLEKLNISRVRAADISEISNLANLKHLNFERNSVKDISPLKNLVELEVLSFGGNYVEDISVLSNLTNLQHLHFGGSPLPVSGNLVTDLSPLKELTNLKYLNFYDNQVKNISSLENLTNLESLNFANNKVKDISVVANLSALQKLDFGGLQGWSEGNLVEDVSALEYLPELNHLNFCENKVYDITPLVNNDNFGSGDEIDMRKNYLDLTPGSEDMINVQKLIDRGVKVSYEPQKD